jgi:8-oxo-dGTP diphosphatase
VSSALATAYGGVLVDEQGRVLLREPAGHYDDYVWTFPKGRPDPGETPEQAALREVKEETGYTAEIVAKLPGSYPGGVTRTEYFLMRPLGEPGPYDLAETANVQWATLEKARELIGLTTNPMGRKRDQGVLSIAGAFPSTRSTRTTAVCDQT